MARILIVDDDPDFLEVTRLILQHEQHEVLTASNGQNGLQVARERRPDVILLDIMMTYVLEGVDVARQLRADPCLQDVPIVIVSSFAGPQGTDLLPPGERLKVDGWLAKPVNPDELLQTVRQLVARPGPTAPAGSEAGIV